MARNWTPKTDAELDVEIEAARKPEKMETVCALDARYHPSNELVEVRLNNGCRFSFPAQMGQGLKGASADDLARVEVMPGGLSLHWESLDADLTVEAMMRGVFGTRQWMQALGRAGGLAKSEAKAAAVRENGKKGGRPRKRDAVAEAASVKVARAKG
jgi:hypothetical protein